MICQLHLGRLGSAAGFTTSVSRFPSPRGRQDNPARCLIRLISTVAMVPLEIRMSEDLDAGNRGIGKHEIHQTVQLRFGNLIQFVLIEWKMHQREDPG
jgi:hypothetical protein